MSLIVDQDATGVSALVQEELLRIDILRLENSIAHLERSNSELAIELERLGVTSIGPARKRLGHTAKTQISERDESEVSILEARVRCKKRTVKPILESIATAIV